MIAKNINLRDLKVSAGQRVLMNAGKISLEKSRLQAPRGLIQLSTTKQDGRSSSLRLANSILDVQAHPFEQGKSTFSEESASRIGLFSAGSITLDHTTLNTSHQVYQSINPSQSKSSDRSALQDRSGAIYLKAQGGIQLSFGNALADAKDVVAGSITLVSEGDDSTCGIKVNRSLISATNPGNWRESWPPVPRSQIQTLGSTAARPPWPLVCSATATSTPGCFRPPASWKWSRGGSWRSRYPARAPGWSGGCCGCCVPSRAACCICPASPRP